MESAVEDGCNLLVEVNGMVGNHGMRALCLVGCDQLLIAPRLGLKHVYEDNSRSEKDLLTHVMHAAAWANVVSVRGCASSPPDSSASH